MELYLTLSIVDRQNTDVLLEICHELKMSFVLTALGSGTATSEHLTLYNLEPDEKSIIFSVAGDDTIKKMIRKAKEELYIDIPGNGIMMAVPIKSVGGGKTLEYLTDAQKIGGANPEMKFENELIVVILNEGYSDAVMDAAREAGSTGGTLMHAKGTGKTGTEKFFEVSLAEEKDMIYILASADKKTEIIQAINQKCGTTTKIGAICFSLPVSEVAGVRCLELDHE